MSDTRDLEMLRNFLTPAGVRELASAHLDFLELMNDDRTFLRESLAHALGDGRIRGPHAEVFVQAARHESPSAMAVLLRLKELHSEKRKPGPPKGRPLKIRQGGDWTPQALKAELARLGLSEARLAGLIGINQKSVNKWCRIAIPDERQEQISAVLKAYEEGLTP